jgi:hypothetical protein
MKRVDEESLALPQAERIYIADIEHRGLTLSRKGFPAFAAALRQADKAGLAKFLAPEFRGVLLDENDGQGPATEALRIRRVIAGPQFGIRGRETSRDAFVDYLIGRRQQAGRDAVVEVALMALSPIERTKLDGAWKGACALRLAGKTASGELRETAITFAFRFSRIPDLDVIADTPGWIESLEMTYLQEARAPRVLFDEASVRLGINTNLYSDAWHLPPERRAIVSGGVFLADIDNDGWHELLVTDLRGMTLFRRREDGRYEDIAGPAGLPRRAAVANVCFGDFEGDGWVDVILDNRIFRNEGGRFTDITSGTNLRLSDPRLGEVSAYTVGDYDRDGRLDLYVSCSHGVSAKGSHNSWIDGPGGPGNQLWRNLGDWQFENVSASANATAGSRSCFTSAWLDANNDFWPDIYVINEFGGGVLLVNRGDGTFRELPLMDDAGDFGSMGMAVGDYNNDGNIDVFTANMYSKSGRRIMDNLAPDAFPPEVFAKMNRFVTGSELYQNHGGLKFSRVGQKLRVHAVGWSYGATLADLDNDGFLDLYGTAGFFSVNKEEPDG